MTADFWYPPKEFIKKVSLRITNEVDGVSRVVYDLTSKPPGECCREHIGVWVCSFEYWLNIEQGRLRWNDDTVSLHKDFIGGGVRMGGSLLKQALYP